MATPFQLKPDVVYDISGNDPGAALDKAEPKPYAVIPRAAFARYWGNPFMPYAAYSVDVDPIAASTFAATRGLGIRCGAYAYILQGKMDRQIDAFTESVKDAGLLVGGKWMAEIPPVADVEAELDVAVAKKKPKNYIEPIKGTAWAAQIKYWLDSVEQVCGVRPWIYTARPQWAYLLDSRGNPPIWTKDYFYWLKFYPFMEYIDRNAAFPAGGLPTGVTMERVAMWQYFDKGRTYGYQYNDINTMTEAGKSLLSMPESAPTPTSPPTPLPQEERSKPSVIVTVKGEVDVQIVRES